MYRYCSKLSIQRNFSKVLEKMLGGTTPPPPQIRLVGTHAPCAPMVPPPMDVDWMPSLVAICRDDADTKLQNRHLGFGQWH